MRMDPSDSHSPEQFSISAEHEAFISGSGRRIYWFMLALCAAGVAAFWAWRGWHWAGGFAAGSALSVLNFHWLHRAVSSLTRHFLVPVADDAQRATPSAPGAAGNAFRIMLRYALMAGAAYAIFV